MRRLLFAAVLLLANTPASAQEAALPLDLGGPFTLIDQTGAIRTEADPGGHPQLLFFGYAACEQICSVALPTMAEAVRALHTAGLELTPVMITVDPKRDVQKVLGEKLAVLHPHFIGLTGSEAALARAYRAYGVDSEPVFDDPFIGEVFAHGSFIYLLDARGKFLTLFPPILAPDRVTAIVRSYVGKSARG